MHRHTNRHTHIHTHTHTHTHPQLKALIHYTKSVSMCRSVSLRLGPFLWVAWAEPCQRRVSVAAGSLNPDVPPLSLLGVCQGRPREKNGLEVLDRLSHLKAGLSAGQRNDWPWFQHAWDQAMVAEHKGKWASVFSGWVQHVLDDERSNAFSEFVHSETCRVLADSAALQVPGI